MAQRLCSCTYVERGCGFNSYAEDSGEEVNTLVDMLGRDLGNYKFLSWTKNLQSLFTDLFSQISAFLESLCSLSHSAIVLETQLTLLTTWGRLCEFGFFILLSKLKI